MYENVEGSKEGNREMGKHIYGSLRGDHLQGESDKEKRVLNNSKLTFLIPKLGLYTITIHYISVTTHCNYL